MLIATYNINNINRRFAVLQEWLQARRPDVVCLQELKCTDAAFPVRRLSELGYDAVWKGERTWNGVAILSRIGQPVLTRSSLPGNPGDNQSRYIEAAVRGVIIASIYAPNGNPRPGPKFDYKLDWLGRLYRHSTALRKTKAPIVLAGDFNVAPTDFDIYSTRSWTNDALIQPESRAAWRKLVGRSWIDAIRSMSSDKPCYTFWSYYRNRWQRDAGLRLDHLLLNRTFASRLVEAGVDRDLRAHVDASDHAPAWIRLRGG